MLSSLSRLIRPAGQDPYRHLLPQVVDGLGLDRSQIEHIEERLLALIQQACGWLDKQIATIPGILAISEARFSQLGMASRLLGSAEDMGAAIGKSLEVKSALPGLMRGGHPEVHALLGMRVRRRDDGGTKFTDHTLAALAPTSDDVRKFLRDIVFMRVVSNCASFQDGRPQSEFRTASNRTVEEKLAALVDLLSAPDTFFRLEASGFRIPGSAPATADLDLPLMHCSDRRQWIVCFVSLRIDEAVAAQNREPGKHRYIYL